MKKKIMALVLALTVGGAMIVGCGTDSESNDESQVSSISETETESELSVLTSFGDISAEDADYTPNPDYDMYTIVSYVHESTGSTLLITCSAMSDGSEYFLEYDFFAQTQIVICDSEGNVSYDDSGFMTADTPDMISYILENAIWSAIPEGTPAVEVNTDEVYTTDNIEEFEYYNSLYEGTGFVYLEDEIEEYKSISSDQAGTVEYIEYETSAYAVNAVLGTDYTITKGAYVYLPYGYDENEEYNVLYLMHGGGDYETYWLTENDNYSDGETNGTTTCNLLDNMIEEGLCDPVIVVTPTFKSYVDGVEITDDDCTALIEELGEENYSSLEDLFTWYFQYELRNDIIPAVESQYSTYAAGNVSDESLINSRDHRAFAGLSMGSITSMHSALMGNLDYISYIGSYSGAKTDLDLFESAIDEKFAEYDVNYWYNGNGTNDMAFDEHYQFYQDIMTNMSDKFVDGENSAMVVIPNGEHYYSAWIVDLYNSLMVFFK